MRKLGTVEKMKTRMRHFCCVCYGQRMVIEIRIDAALASAAVAAGAVVTKEGLAEPPAAGLARLELPPEAAVKELPGKGMPELRPGLNCC